ncbi:MAG: apolipoprotein N-acyltransferase [Janthinobacterium lividum]
MPAVSTIPTRAAQRALPLLLAASFGALNTLSFAPVPHGGWLEIGVFIAYFLLLFRARSAAGAFAAGLAFGCGGFLSGIWWLYISMHFYGGMAPPLAAGAVLLFSIYLGFYAGLAALLWRLLSRGRRNWPSAVAMASAWALGEWLRGTVFTGFPWLASGYAQTDGPLGGYASLVGVYGIGWVLALLAALLAQVVAGWPSRNDEPLETVVPAIAASAPVAAPGAAAMPDGGVRTADRHQAATNALFHFAPRLLVGFLLIAGGLLASRIAWTVPSRTSVSVRLLQGSVQQDMKFGQAGIDHALALYQALITATPADLIVTPETAIPVLMQTIPASFAESVRHFADTTGSSVLLGTIGARLTPAGPTDFTNTTLGVTAGQAGVFRYDKHHLVPFGEFVPWGFRWFVDLMNIPLGDFSRGAPVQPPFEAHGVRFAVDICYEDIFGEEIARTLRGQRQTADVLVNSTNLAWFGNTVALDQHLQIARMRALETERPVLRATNTGATAVIDAQGHVRERLPAFAVGALTARVSGTSGLTPYVRLGNLSVLLVSCLGLLWAAVPLAKARRRT